MKKPTHKICLSGIVAIVLIFSGWIVYSAQSGVQEIYKNATGPVDDEKSVDAVISLPDNIVLVNT